MREQKVLKTTKSNWLRVLTIVALVLVLLLVTLLIVESLTPSSKSGAFTSWVASLFNNNEVTEVMPTGITVTANKTSGYNGEKIKLTTKFSPQNATQQNVTYTTSNSYIATVDSKGEVTLLEMGTVEITITSVVDQNLVSTVEVTSLGANPNAVETLEWNLDSNVFVGQDIEFRLDGISVDGKRTKMQHTMVSLQYDSTKLMVSNGVINPLAIGEITLTAKVGEALVVHTFNVSENPSYVAPTSILLDTVQHEIDVDDIINVTQITTEPENSFKSVRLESSNSKVAIVNGNKIKAVGKGECTVTVSSLYNSNVKATITIVVRPILPKSATIVASDRIAIENNYKFAVKFANTPSDKSVTWSVVEGQDKAYFDENGKLHANKIGEITIRATSNADASVFAEKTIKISFFGSFYMFVRKMLGHFGCFVFLGIGVSFCTLALSRQNRQWLAVLLSVLVCFTMAGLTELLQLRTSGRVSSWNDVKVDMTGAFIGMLITYVVSFVFCFMYRLINKQRYRQFVGNYNCLRLKTLFVSDKKERKSKDKKAQKKFKQSDVTVATEIEEENIKEE